MEDLYKKAYQQMIADIGDSLRTGDIDRLDYFNKELLQSRRSLALADTTPWTGLGVLRALEEAGLFSPRHLEPLATALCDVKREDLKGAVEEFIDTHRRLKAKPALQRAQDAAKDGPYYDYPPRGGSKKKTVLASTAMPDSTADDNYIDFIPVSKITAQVTSSTTGFSPPHINPSLPPSESGKDEDVYSYPYSHEWGGGNSSIIAMTQTVSPESSLSTTSITSSSATAEDSSDEDYFEYPGTRENWLTTAGSQRQKLTQKMQLKTAPLQSMAKKYENHTIIGDTIKWQLFCLLLELRVHIDPIGPCDGMAATLFLLRKVGNASGGVLKAELRVAVTQPQSQQPERRGESPKKKESSSSLLLFRSSVLMDISDKATPPGIPSVAARFPMIISHSNLLNKKLIQGTHLDITLTLRQHNM